MPIKIYKGNPETSCKKDMKRLVVLSESIKYI